jgi:hypothetical protein
MRHINRLFVNLTGVFLLPFIKQPGTASSNSQEQRKMFGLKWRISSRNEPGPLFVLAEKQREQRTG